MINMLLLLIFFPEFESPVYLFRLKKDQEVRDLLSKYCTPKAVKIMMKDLTDMRDLEEKNSTTDLVKPKMSYCKRIFGIHFVSTMYA